MSKSILLLLSFFLTSQVYAQVRPVISFSGGIADFNLNETQTVTLFPTNPAIIGQNTYVTDDTSPSTQVYGVFLGVEFPFVPYTLMQLGIGGYKAASFDSNGLIYEGPQTVPDFAYEYDINRSRLMFEGKWFLCLFEHLRPYLYAGIGQAKNEASQFTITSLNDTEIPVIGDFTDNTVRDTAYSVGAGIQLNLTEWTRIGLGYRYVDMGNLELGTYPGQPNDDVLESSLTSNEYFLELGFVF